MSRITTSLGPLHVREAGSGQPALLWPSLFVDSDSWKRVEPGLGEHRHLVLVDGPGHGMSGDPGHRYTQLDCARAAIEVLDALGITEPVDWLGNAWGGHVGIHAATEHRERLRSLVTIGTPVAPYTPAERRRTRLLLAIFRLLGPIGFLQEGVAKVLLSPSTRTADFRGGRLRQGPAGGCRPPDAVQRHRVDLPRARGHHLPTAAHRGAHDVRHRLGRPGLHARRGARCHRARAERPGRDRARCGIPAAVGATRRGTTARPRLLGRHGRRRSADVPGGRDGAPARHRVGGDGCLTGFGPSGLTAAPTWRARPIG